MLSIKFVVLKIFLKKIIKTNPIENSTLAIVIKRRDNVYKYKSSIYKPTISVYAYKIIQIISLVMNNFIKFVVFKKNKNHDNQNKTNQKFNIDCITITYKNKCPRIGSNYWPLDFQSNALPLSYLNT